MRLFIVPFLLAQIVALSAAEPRDIAEAAASAWLDKNPERLLAVAHPELINRARSARICQHFFEKQPDKLQHLRTGSEGEVVALLCEAMRALIPDNKPFDRIREYQKTELRGDLAIVMFQTGWKAPGASQPRLSDELIVLKKSGDDWKFLWSMSANIHIDLEWDPMRGPSAPAQP